MQAAGGVAGKRQGQKRSRETHKKEGNVSHMIATNLKKEENEREE